MCAAADNMPYPKMVGEWFNPLQPRRKEEKGKKHEVSAATQHSRVFAAAFKEEEEEEEWSAFERVIS